MGIRCEYLYVMEIKVTTNLGIVSKVKFHVCDSCEIAKMLMLAKG